MEKDKSIDLEIFTLVIDGIWPRFSMKSIKISEEVNFFRWLMVEVSQGTWSLQIEVEGGRVRLLPEVINSHQESNFLLFWGD